MYMSSYIYKTNIQMFFVRKYAFSAIIFVLHQCVFMFIILALITSQCESFFLLSESFYCLSTYL